MFNINGWEFVFVVVLFLLLFGPEKLPVVIVEGMKLFKQLRAAAEQATDEIRREFEAAASEIEAAKHELTAAAEDVQRFGAETRALVEDTQRQAAGEPSILPPALAAAANVDADADADIDPAAHAIEAMGGGSGAGASPSPLDDLGAVGVDIAPRAAAGAADGEEAAEAEIEEATG